MKELLKEMHSWMDAYMKSFHTDDEEVMQGIRIKELPATFRHQNQMIRKRVYAVEFSREMLTFHDHNHITLI